MYVCAYGSRLKMRPGLSPAPAHKSMPSVAIFVMVGHPMRPWMRRLRPTAPFPLPPSSAPNPRPSDPDKVRPRRNRDRFVNRRRRRGVRINHPGFGGHDRCAARPPVANLASCRQNGTRRKNSSNSNQVRSLHKTSKQRSATQRPRSRCQTVGKTPMRGCCFALADSVTT